MDNTVYPFLTQTLFPGGEGVKRASNRASHSMGLLGLLLMALGLASSKALQNTGMAFMLLAMVLERGIVWPVLKRDSLSKAIGLWLIYLLLRTVLAAWEFPELAADQFDNAREMSRPFLIILVAWWVGGTPRSVLNLYLVSFSGLLLAIAYRVDWLNLRVFLNARIGLGMNTQHLGLITVTAIIGWLVFATDLWGRQRILRTYGIKVLLWLMFLALLLFILLRSQARAAWAAFILWGFFALLYCLRKFFRYPRLPYSRKNILAYAAAVLLAVGIVSSQLNAVATRLSQEKGTVERLLAGNVSEMPSTSLGIRFYLWKLGLHRWSERKIFGWGPGTTAFLIEKSDMPDVVKSCCSHELHNSFLEIPLRTGIIGLFFFAGATFVILRSIFRSVQRREITEKAAFFSVSVLFVFMVTNLSEAYVELQIGWFFFALFGGSVYSFKLWEAPARAVKDSGNIQIIEPPGEGDVVSSNKSRQRKSRYRVLLITNGCHITETQFVRRLYEAGIDLVFITDPFYQDLDKLMKWKIPTVQLALRSHFDRAAIRTIRQMIRSEGFDIVHTSANRPLTNSLWASYGTGVKLIAYRGAIGHVHRWDPSSWLKWLNPRVDRVVCVSNAVREDLLSAGVKAEKLLTIYKGHDLKWYENLGKVDLGQFGVPPGAFLVGCVANMRRVKGVDVLVRAAHFMPEASPVHFLLVGEVRDPLIKKLANDPRICRRIHFAGYHRDAPAIIGQCHVAVMPSRGREGLTKAIIEAMAQGVPAVVTDAGGLPELVFDGECGFVVQQDDPEAIAESISRLCRDAHLRRRFGEEAKRRIGEKLNIDRSVRETIAMYEGLVTSK